MGMKGRSSIEEVEKANMLPEELLVPEETKKNIMRTAKTQSYIERGPITITSDFHLNNSGFLGNGIVDDPIRIEGYNITASSGDLIQISGTTYHFRIENCLLNGLETSENGITFDNVINGSIVNNTIVSAMYDGIVLTSSPNNTIKDNSISNNIDGGIEIISSNNVTVQDNNILDNGGVGLILYGSSVITGSKDCLIQGNRIFGNVAGIEIFDNSTHNTIIDNRISSNTIGINHWHSNNNLITGNAFNYNIENGIYIGDSKHTTIRNNVFYMNQIRGIVLDSLSEQNTIMNNDLKNNTPPQADDDGLNNNFTHNYWDDWTGIGTYTLGGSAENEDTSPLELPNRISPPTITASTYESPTLENNWVIQWEATRDAFGYPITYSVLYSTDEGETWIDVVTDLNTTTYTLDSNTLQNGLKFRLKIEAKDYVGFITHDIAPVTFLVLNGPSPPVIVYPNGGETLTDMVVIEWEEALDPVNHSITYSVYYSSNDGALWTELTNGIITTNYSWNTTTVPNGLSYLIKIEAICTAGKSSEDISDTVFTVVNDISTSVPTTTTSDIPGMTGMVLLGTLMIMIRVRKKKDKD
jgi:parallel beta-helix repeat protein